MPFKKIVETVGSYVNISGAHLAELMTDEPGQNPVYGDFHFIRGMQDLKRSQDQERIVNWGDGQEQESAVTQGPIKVDLQYFAVPLDIRAWLSGREVDEDGVVITRGGVLNPPYVGGIFFLEKANGDIEAIGLTRGMFTVGDDEGKTAEEKTEFGNKSISGEFSQRRADNVSEKRMLIKKNDKDTLNKFYNMIFFKDAPATAYPPTWTVTLPSQDGTAVTTPATNPEGI